MRKKLTEELIDDAGEIWYDGLPEGWTFQEAIAEEVIKAVEKLGMLPPSFCFYATGEHIDSKEFLDLDLGFDGNFEWEPEE